MYVCVCNHRICELIFERSDRNSTQKAERYSHTAGERALYLSRHPNRAAHQIFIPLCNCFINTIQFNPTCSACLNEQEDTDNGKQVYQCGGKLEGGD